MSMSYNMQWSSATASPKSQNRVTFAPSTYVSSSAPQTPKGRTKTTSRRPANNSQQQGSRRQRTRSTVSFSTPCYAGSSFSDSPAARAVPLPPSDWIEEVCANESDSDNVSVTDSVASSTTSTTSSGSNPVRGIRLNPLQLIQAVTVGAS